MKKHIFAGLSDGSIFLSQIENENNTIIIRSFKVLKLKSY